MCRLLDGECNVINPWNRKSYKVSLKSYDVDGFVFWTKNLAPFQSNLVNILKLAPFYIQYTITGYPRALERSVVPSEHGVRVINYIAKMFGKRAVVWRYDPIIFTTLTTENWHIEQFKKLAGRLENTTEEVTVSFLNAYKKTKRNLNIASRTFNFEWYLPEAKKCKDLLNKLSLIAHDHGMVLTICSQPHLAMKHIAEASCIDVNRLNLLGGMSLPAKTKGNRPGCLCNTSRDIGSYDSCPHGCCYCYAVSSSELAKSRYNSQNPSLGPN